MRVHIVARDHTSDQVLARLAADLGRHPAFTVGDTPDPRAELNYFAPYLEMEPFLDFKATKTAAWFSHRDDGRPEKVRTWDLVAKAVDLRTYSAPVYRTTLEPFGPCAVVTPPLDREAFTPGARQVRERRVVGTSGFVYPGGRKGEHLFARLTMDFIHEDFVACGQGWSGMPCRHLSWSQVPDFYRSLDVYVCTSTIEGIGYGPLEAMACGIPVVIPRGVGVFDDLPDLENVHRYTAGDYVSLKAALATALARLDEGGYNPTSLRGATARYSVEAWQNSHVEAFEHLLYDVRRYPVEHSWDGKAGVYYVAYGEPARDCARRAIASFKKYMPPSIEIALVSDAPLNAGEDIFIQHEDEDVGGRSVKTKIDELAPAHWSYVIYLDADTEVTADVSVLLDFLQDGWSLAICLNPNKYVTGTWMRRPDNEDECNETFKLIGTEEFIQLNGGVFAYRRHEATARFFQQWHAEWLRYGRRDQAALDRVLYTDPIRVYVLGVEFNTVTRYEPAERTAGILHHPTSARRWRGMLPGRLDSDESWAVLHPAYKPEGK